MENRPKDKFNAAIAAGNKNSAPDGSRKAAKTRKDAKLSRRDRREK
jgi:hypothetical protein